MSKHREVLERDLGLAMDRQKIMLINANEAKKEGHINDASYFQHEADEAQERAGAIRHALGIMKKAETLPKTADGVTVWPGTDVYFFPGVGLIWGCKVNSGVAVFWNGRSDVGVPISSCYSTEQAARDAAEGKK